MKDPAINTLTSCFRNILDHPPQQSVIGYGDKFILSRLGLYGKGKFLGSIIPSFYRIHSGGMHTGATIMTRQVMDLRTYVAAATYYKRINKEELYLYFLQQSIRQVHDIDWIDEEFVFVARALSSGWRFVKRLVRFSNRRLRSISSIFFDSEN
jgi:hypothetical protein